MSPTQAGQSGPVFYYLSFKQWLNMTGRKLAVLSLNTVQVLNGFLKSGRKSTKIDGFRTPRTLACWIYAPDIPHMMPKTCPDMPQKICKYALYESSEGLFCGRRKPANPWHPARKYYLKGEERSFVEHLILQAYLIFVIFFTLADFKA